MWFVIKVQSNMNLNAKILNGAIISSSGTTGDPKKVYRSPENIKACSKVAAARQMINQNSSIYTVTRMTHAGGLLLQTIPAIIQNASYEIDSFNAWTFLSKFEKHTHTFLPPKMVEALIKTKSFKTADLSGKFIALGSDSIPAYHVNELTSRGATVLSNWGMSEIGPCVINKLYKPGEIETRDNVLGNHWDASIKIVDGELCVKSEMCVYDDWFPTNDLVSEEKGTLYYEGRINGS